ncbi:cyclase/dehydrase [Ketogulonicigenium robustum]|uniref:Cyclase/dehydrase n=1 Tax=Ketogulonicigenium robustum TaxID=92947 RepID=A0A1W6NZY0_9RHOB|nr:type II toxin-antitoxin system RatA family toxin [Ketogulonicigenium robustum]ARO14759.1 cyclase/dehydrase [Ketogulonicigenium robustum]
MTSHHETRQLPYNGRQVYDLVADVAAYGQFLPWVAGARVRKVDDMGDHQVMLADLIVSFKLFREKFGSRVVLWPDDLRIDTSYIDGPFEHMESRWQFRDTDAGCEVSFDVDFAFRNKLLQGAAGLFFHEAMRQIVAAFERRAADLYGAA